MSFDHDTLTEIKHPLLTKQGVFLSVWQDQGLEPEISGNKWRKLKYNIKKMQREGLNCAASFGGPYSNHLHALAFAGKTLGFNTVGFIRGEIHKPYNPTLQDAVSWGMRLVSVSRADYRNKNDPAFLKRISAPFAPCYLIPEGGANLLSIKGCTELGAEICKSTKTIDFLCAPCGTGTTLAGLIAGSSDCHVLGFNALKNNLDLDKNIAVMRKETGEDSAAATKQQWRIVHDYHFGGFAKINSPLVLFMDEWLEHTGVALDPVYTAKMLYGIFDLIKKGFFKPGSHIVAVHTGGLQGLRGMQEKMDRIRTARIPGDTISSAG